MNHRIGNEPKRRDNSRAISGGMLMESSHVSALQLRHAGIERKIAEEQTRPAPDQSMVQSLKKRKLRIKEELSHL